MDKWDQAKLEQVVSSKERATDKNQPNKQTEIVCKYFLEAIETKKYGWFWVCPNGGDKCAYRHALPPGYVLKAKPNPASLEDLDEDPKDALEDFIENKRKEITGSTPVTLDRFLRWKEEKRIKKQQEKEEEERKLESRASSHTSRAMMSGRKMFEYNPELFLDDDEALGEDDYGDDEANSDDDQSIPHNIVTVTDTSITLTRVTKKKPSNTTTTTTTTTISTTNDEDGDQDEDQEQNGEDDDHQNHDDADDDDEDEEEEFHREKSEKGEKDLAVDESLFADDIDDLPDDEDT